MVTKSAANEFIDRHVLFSSFSHYRERCKVMRLTILIFYTLQCNICFQTYIAINIKEYE